MTPTRVPDNTSAPTLEYTTKLRETQINNVVKRLEKDDPAYQFVVTTWAPELLALNHKSSKNGFATQTLSVTQLVLTVPVPLLAGLSLNGNGATAVRWLTFGLSLSAALISSYVWRRGYEPRWRLYHRYASRLLQEGRLYSEKAGVYAMETGQQQAVPAANLFVQRVCGALSEMSEEYAALVHTTATTAAAA